MGHSLPSLQHLPPLWARSESTACLHITARVIPSSFKFFGAILSQVSLSNPWQALWPSVRTEADSF